MKKRILFAIHYLELGGAEISLIGLLQAMDYSRYDVDLFVYSHRGELMKFIPDPVNLLPEIPEYAQIERSVKSVIRDGYWRIAWRRFLAKYPTGRFARRHPSEDSAAGLQYAAHFVTPVLPAINPETEYDVAVSFLTPHNIVRDKVRAKKKIAWIHTDYSVVSVDARAELPVWMAYDKIVSVSDDVTKSFITVFPEAESKIVTIENILSPGFVERRSEEFDARPDYLKHFLGGNPFIILTVGRFCYPKNMDSIPSILRGIDALLPERREDIKWFIIGYGPDREIIRRSITEAGMADRVILLGKRSNPYPYIKACDLYVQPSRYEGKAVTVREAQMLCKPVIVTDYPTAKSQVLDGQDGIIVPMDVKGCAEGIVSLIKDRERQGRLVSYLEEHDFGNESEIEKFYCLLP